MRLFPLVLCCLAGSAFAQTKTVVVPPGWDTMKFGHWPGNFMTWPQRGMPVHVQFGYDLNDFPRRNLMLTAMEFRKFASVRDEPGATVDLGIELSINGTSPRNFSTAFGANIGLGRSLVFLGKLKWPRTPATTTPIFNVKVPFTRPFPLSATGTSLVVDVNVTMTTLSSGDWQYDTAATDNGGRSGDNHANSACKDSMGQRLAGVAYVDDMKPGGMFDLSYGTGRPFITGIASIGFTGVGGRWGGMLLPIDLKPLGAPNCFWAIAPAWMTGFIADMWGSTNVVKIPIPNVPSVAGMSVYDQGLIFDPAANALGVVTFRSSRWVIGTGKVPSVVTVGAINDFPTKFNGDIYYRAPLVRFTYQ